MGRVARARVGGPLAPFADGFRAELDRLGYTPNTREYKVNEMARLSRWLEDQGLAAGDVDGARVEAFLVAFGVNRQHVPTFRAMRPLLGWLRSEGVIGPDPAAPRQPVDDLLDDYRRWMVADRALADRTIGRYRATARRFLLGRAGAPGVATGAEGLTADAVTAFLLSEVGRGLSPGSLQGRVAELLDRGVRLPEIAHVLRQRDLATTAVYAKVDHARLREFALPWPAVAP